MSNHSQLSKAELYKLFEIKHGDPKLAGPSPKRRLKFGYFQPEDFYEATLIKLVNEETKWLDVGGGSGIFPRNLPLSQILSKKCNKLVAVDPSENVLENSYAHEKSMCMLEDYQINEHFDLATFRMVAEHIDDPDAVLIQLDKLLKPEGVVVIYTINKFSPIPIITWLTPFSFHYKVKNFFWGGEEKNTFPVAYKMNTRSEIRRIFNKHGFYEESFEVLDDLSTFSRFKFLNLVELVIWKGLRFIGIKYPENNLLGIYKRKNAFT